MAAQRGSDFFRRVGSEPLAARMRPETLDEFVGQDQIVGPGKLLRRAIEADQLSSILLWGPPGCGKTTLAYIIARHTESQFLTINAVLAGVKDIREAIKQATEHWAAEQRRTILFIDEVHRFNKAQQDALLPHVENGTIILIGATTENPYFEVIKPLVSRSRIFSLKKLEAADLVQLLRNALADPVRGYGARQITMSAEAIEHLSDMAHGDARSALNALELAVETTEPGATGSIIIDRDVAEESIQRRALLYDKDGDAHYDAISAFIKSLRGSDPDAALYWMARMLRSGEDPRFIARRMIIFASEDVGLADPAALQLAVAAAHAVDYVGMPECQFNLSEACIYLATAEKSNSTMAYFDALKTVEREGADEVPDHLKDPSRDRHGLGHGAGYRYPHAYRDHWVAQQYLPEKLEGRYFYHPSDQGYEGTVRKRLAGLRQATAGERAQKHGAERSAGHAWEGWQRKIHGSGAIGQRDLLLGQATIGADAVVLDLGSAGLLGWGALKEVPLGRVVCLFPDVRERSEFTSRRSTYRVDRLLHGITADCRLLPFGGGVFRLVLARGALVRAADPSLLLAEVRRVLRPEGQFSFAEALPARRRRLWQEIDLRGLPEELAGKVIAAEESLYRSSGALYGLDENRLSALAREAGFRIESLDLRQEKEYITATSAFFRRLFDPADPQSPPSYGDRLREHLAEGELVRVRKEITAQLQGRTIERQTVIAYVVARPE